MLLPKDKIQEHKKGRDLKCMSVCRGIKRFKFRLLISSAFFLSITCEYCCVCVFRN